MCEKSCTKCQEKLTNPTKDWTFGHILGVASLGTPATLTGSISTQPSERMRPRYLTLGCLKIHFSTLWYSLCFPKDVKDLYYDGVVFLFCLATKDEDVIHVR